VLDFAVITVPAPLLINPTNILSGKLKDVPSQLVQQLSTLRDENPQVPVVWLFLEGGVDEYNVVFCLLKH
jgi:hypothetical protein